MSNGWRPKYIRNNGWTTAHDRERLMYQGILIGSAHSKYASSPTPQPDTPTSEPKGGRFAQNTQPPTPEQLAGHIKAQMPSGRYGDGYHRVGGVKQEGRGYRDMWLSNRHRQWGEDVPMVDADFWAIEYDRAKTVALIEYKCGVTDNGYVLPAPDFSRASYRAQIDLANRADIYIFVVYYFKGTASFKVYPANEKTLQLAKGRTEILFSEEEWVERLYWIRGRSMPDEVRANLSKTK